MVCPDEPGNRHRVSIAEDYAVLRVNDRCEFYYGYEVTDEESAWCFIARVAGHEVILIRDDLGQIEEDACAENLLQGISLFLEHHRDWLQEV